MTFRAVRFRHPARLFSVAPPVRAKGLPFAPLEADGDGSVPLAAAELPPALKNGARLARTGYAHDKLFEDPAVRQDCLEFLAEGN